MSDDSYKLGKLWKAYSTTGKDQLMLGTFNYATSFTLWKEGNNRPALKTVIPVHIAMKIVATLKDLMKATPNTRLSIVKMQYDQQSKSYSPDISYVFGKDEKNVMYIEVGNKEVNPPLRFDFRTPGGFSFPGQENVSEADRSMFGVQTFIKILEKYVPIAEMLSTWNMQPPKFQGNSGGGGGGSYNRGGGAPAPSYQQNDGDLF